MLLRRIRLQDTAPVPWKEKLREFRVRSPEQTGNGSEKTRRQLQGLRRGSR